MFNIGGGEILVIMLIALIVLGPQRLPEAARKIGNAVGEVRRIANGFQNEMKTAFEDAERATKAPFEEADRALKADPKKPDVKTTSAVPAGSTSDADPASAAPDAAPPPPPAPAEPFAEKGHPADLGFGNGGRSVTPAPTAGDAGDAEPGGESQSDAVD